MNDNSWLYFSRQDLVWILLQELVEIDFFGVCDCGWVEQMQLFIVYLCLFDGKVFDFFCGFGSMLVVVYSVGCVGIGIEIDGQCVVLMCQWLQCFGVDGLLQ